MDELKTFKKRRRKGETVKEQLQREEMEMRRGKSIEQELAKQITEET